MLVTTAALLVAALAATSQAQAATVYACVKKNGSARIFTKKPKCKKGESALSWSNVGAAGKNGANGANGTNGSNGKDGTNGTEGKEGKEGAAGQPQKAAAFNVTKDTGTTTSLFSVGGVTVKLECFNFIANFADLEATAPAGSHAETGALVTNSENTAPEINQEPVKDVNLSATFTSIAKVSTNLKAPIANIGHVNGSISTPTSVVLFDAFVEAAPSPSACTVRGTAFSIPL
ncbi:MAG TPA: hypothetical protein VF706_01445 [Solirubrobacteraceae bacterium]